MAIKHKRKATTGYTWQSGDLVEGQIGVNTADGTLHVKKTDNNIANITGNISSSSVFNIVSITQTAYDALTPDANTMYLITG